ncbi:hypothetical protein RRG08_042583 [Elysia crispata]|uniref:Uncharacterized protein n=1 Tax=Elysia crispata TaxID=231223 RepID=A0AAE1CJZ0_9GAST|nr:hypothetical protein RRG08_042583 [Elysia crispata]
MQPLSRNLTVTSIVHIIIFMYVALGLTAVVATGQSRFIVQPAIVHCRVEHSRPGVSYQWPGQALGARSSGGHSSWVLQNRK